MFANNRFFRYFFYYDYYFKVYNNVFTCKYLKNFVNSIFTFIVNGIFGDGHSGFFP